MTAAPTALPARETAVLLLAHGSRDPSWAEPFQRLEATLRAAWPGCALGLAFLERMRPTLDEAADRLLGDPTRTLREVRVVPLFLGAGGHVRGDLPPAVAALAERYPQLEFHLERSIGDAPELEAAMAAAVLRMAAAPAASETADSPAPGGAAS